RVRNVRHNLLLFLITLAWGICGITVRETIAQKKTRKVAMYSSMSNIIVDVESVFQNRISTNKSVFFFFKKTY
ncbi:hypothetical protein, partial [Geobacillus stearothermophilus]|uniref:hypothetical protein n=1 Tax=Geobacillus stearothermophilus TaxID=1422 RepID=UPI003D21448D